MTLVPIGITCLLAHVYFLSMSAEMSGWESAVLVTTWKEQTCFGTLAGQLTQSQVTTGCALSLTLLPSQVAQPGFLPLELALGKVVVSDRL